MMVPAVGGAMALSGFTMLLVTNLMTSLLVMTGLMGGGVLGCNEAVCASIVSKCMLLQSCKCELQPDCTCCKVKYLSAMRYMLLFSAFIFAEVFRVSGLLVQ